MRNLGNATNLRPQMPCSLCGDGLCGGEAPMIYADNNATGRRMLNYVPEIGLLEVAEPGDMLEYVDPNSNRGPVGKALRDALSNLEGVLPEHIVIDGSGLSRLKLLPNIFGAKSVVTIANDFPGYKAAATACKLPHHEIPCGLWDQTLSPSGAGDVVKDLDTPLVFLSMPVTNPGQTVVTLRVAEAVLENNPSALVVIDSAYRRDNVLSEDYVRFALEHPGVLYMNVAAKDLGACGARISWMIGAPDMLDAVRSDICPYPVSMHAARYVTKIAMRPQVVEKIHRVQRAAVEVFREWLPSSGLKYKTGAGPWVLLQIGPNVSEVVTDLERNFRVRVQDQSGRAANLKGWVRVSATVPCDAHRVTVALSRRLLAI
jgi:histidinol-phosphate/aromatic aminotransferase/cobyric acid decarboxylase-like protein